MVRGLVCLSFITYTFSGSNEQPVFTVQPTCSSLHLFFVGNTGSADNNNRKALRVCDYELCEL